MTAVIKTIEVKKEKKAKKPTKLNQNMINEFSRLALMGKNRSQICTVLGVTYATFTSWLHRGRQEYESGHIDTIYARFAAAFYLSERERIKEVEDSLYRSAVGGVVRSKKVKIHADGMQEITEEEKEIGGSVEAQKFFLTNRSRNRWGENAANTTINISTIGVASEQVDGDSWVKKYSKHAAAKEQNMEDDAEFSRPELLEIHAVPSDEVVEEDDQDDDDEGTGT